MYKRILRIVFFIEILMCYQHEVKAQRTDIDTTYIHTFVKKNNAEIYTGLYRAKFNFSDPGEEHVNYRLDANSSNFVGADINYKWFSLNFSTAIYGTQLDNNSKAKYVSIGLTINGKRLMYTPFYTAYTGLLVPNVLRNDRYTPLTGIRFVDAGTDVYYYFNAEHFSFRASSYYAQEQKKIAGSMILGVTPRWQKIRWQNPSRNTTIDTGSYNLLASDPQWLSLVVRLGYTYAYTFKGGKWKIEPAALLGGGGLKEINTKNRDLQWVREFQGWINTGYNGNNYYAYLRASLTNLHSDLFTKDMTQINSDLTFTIGYRFDTLPKKVLGIL